MRNGNILRTTVFHYALSSKDYTKKDKTQKTWCIVVRFSGHCFINSIGHILSVKEDCCFNKTSIILTSTNSKGSFLTSSSLFYCCSYFRKH